MRAAGKSLNFNANSIILSRAPKRKEQTQKYLRDKIAHVVEELKQDIDSRLFFALNGVLEKWEMCLWKVLEFLVQKRVRSLSGNSG